MTRIRTLDFLPSIFQTPTNSQFLGATLDQLVNPPVTKTIQGYVGSKIGYGVDAKDYYVTEPTKVRTDYQLEPGVVFLKENDTTAKDFISYPGIIDSLKGQNGITDSNSELFESQFYSWDSFCSLDTIINYNQYYWLPEGPPAVQVAASTVFKTNDYTVTYTPSAYNIKATGAGTGNLNPTLTLLRGGVYNFIVNQGTKFWIQGAPGVTGYSPTQPNLQTRDVYGVINNGEDVGVVTFEVPQKDAQDQFNYPGNNLVSVVSDKLFSQVSGKLLSEIRAEGGIDGVTDIEGLTVLFFNGRTDEIANTIPSSNTSQVFYKVYYVANPDDPADPYVELQVDSTIPNQQKITPLYGTEYVGLPFVKNIAGLIEKLPYISAPLDTLYYQDSTNPNCVGTIKLIENNNINTINVITDILGQPNYTSKNGVVFTNGLKVQFDGDVVPVSYLQGEYYVEGVGTAIELVPVSSLIVPEPFTTNTTSPYDILPFDIGPFDSALNLPTSQDYITIARNSINKNAWARSNRWFHIQVIQDTATYLNNPDILNIYATPDNKAKRPIIQFYPNLKLFNSGTVAKNNVDFIDFRTQDAFDYVQGQQSYYPDVESYTTYTGSINENITVDVEDILVDQWYSIETLGTNPNETVPSTWETLGAESDVDGDFQIGAEYIISNLGTTTQTEWNIIAGSLNSQPGTFVPDYEYIITDLGTTTNSQWNTIAGTTSVIYSAGDTFTCAVSGTGLGEGKANRVFVSGSVFTAATAGSGNGDGVAIKTLFKSIATGITPSNQLLSSKKYKILTLGTTQWNDIGYVGTPVVGGVFTATGPAVGTGTAVQGTGTVLNKSITTIEIYSTEFTGPMPSIGQWVNDMIIGQKSRLPVGTRILDINQVGIQYTITVYYPQPTDIVPCIWDPLVTDSGASFAFDSKDNTDLALFPGARIVFGGEVNDSIRSKIYNVEFNYVGNNDYKVITLTEAVDGQILENDQFPVQNGYNNQGYSFYYDNLMYVKAQEKLTVNQAPLFDIFDENNISLGNSDIYPSSTFEGCKLFNYKLGVGANDSVLGFPISYSSINNVGDISFEISLYTQEFSYVSTSTGSTTAPVSTGFVYNYSERDVYERLTGWQTAVAPSLQYQVFQFEYFANAIPLVLEPGETFDYAVTCDIPQANVETTKWPTLQVFKNNNILIEGTDYTVENTTTSTIVTVTLSEDVDTPIEVLILSDQVSSQAYYTIPINLANNPFNTDPTSVDIGDIRGQYQTIFANNPNTTGDVFGPNNYRDLGNLVPWGTRIIQNSASLVLPGALLRSPKTNLFDSLLFNSREYIKFKTLLVDTIDRIAYDQKYDPATLLDLALDEITSVKNQEMPFFWSDMLPNKAAYITNVYNFANDLDTSIFPLSRTYNFSTANYDSVLIYIQRKIEGVQVVKQLLTGIDYVISTDSPSVTVTRDLVAGDKVIVKEYNKTYGSYVPNTPTKLGLYPAYIPKAVYDESYDTPTWFILGHDGSLTKMYGEYNEILGLPVDFRDQILLEYETRVYNNLKLSRTLPIVPEEIIPGYFRKTPLSYEQWTAVYSTNFLDWVGQNRLDYKTQVYNKADPWTYNYRGSTFKLDNSFILQGNWRGIYAYLYDTATPNTTPWEMIGYAVKPDWWETQYGPAPYTSNNLILWEDMQAGYDYNNGDPVIRPLFIRDGLLNVLPVDDQGELVQPLDSVIANYNALTFQRNWIVGDDAPVEYSYRNSSTYPFDLMRLQALIKPAAFYNLGVDLDNYKYNVEFNQFLVNGRTHLVPADIQVYGNGTAKTSYLNWIVDYQKQLGVDATKDMLDLLKNLDVRLVYRLAGFSDKQLLKFFVEKSTPGTPNPSLLIPDESYQVLLYDNQPYTKIVYSGVVIQKVATGYAVYGNNQTSAYFKILKPLFNGSTTPITVQDVTVNIATQYENTKEVVVPYGTIFYSVQEVSQFLMSYGKYLESQGMKFEALIQGVEVNWPQMVAEFLYWAQTGWSTSSIVTLNPAAEELVIDKESQIVQPLAYSNSNFILNNNLYPIQNKDLSIFRDGTIFSVKPLNAGDALAYGQFNLSNIEHGIVFNNITLFNDVIYNLITGLKQNRIYVRGTKSAEWNGTMFASGFIYNQDNIENWRPEYKYTKGSIVKYKNKYYSALEIVQPNAKFLENQWKITEYDEIQKGLLPNSSTRSYESALYYNTDKANLENDADQLSFSLIGFRPREYMASADLTDITQVNVYKNLIKDKGTLNAMKAFKGAQLPQGGIDYDIYENWAILQGSYGGLLNNNFVEFALNETLLTGNPSIIGLTDGNGIQGAEQEVPLNKILNYGRPINSPNVFPLLPQDTPSRSFPDAGYVNRDDVWMSAYYYSNLPTAVDKNGIIVPINNLYVGDYVWLANYRANWRILTPDSIGQVLQVRSNLNGTCTVTFKEDHNLSQYDIFAIINFDTIVNGYFVATTIKNPREVLINLTLPGTTKIVTGEGIGLKFTTQRVAQPSEIQYLPLLNNEFTKNTVWVDENNDGGWAVYRKNINYQYDQDFTKPNSVTFGTAVAYTKLSDYLFGDAGQGTVYRYQYDALTETYEQDEVLTNEVSFGTTIVHEQNIYVISQPTGIPKVFLYTVNDTTVSDNIIPYQTINSVSGSTNFGSALALSGDTNWLFISDYNEVTPISRNNVHIYRKRNELTDSGSFVVGKTYQITEVGDTNFKLVGAVTNQVGIYFVATGAGDSLTTGTATRCDYEYIDTISSGTTSIDKFGASLSTNYYGTTLVVGAPTEDYSGSINSWGRAYVYTRLVQNIDMDTTYDPTSSPDYTLAWTPNLSQPLTVTKNGKTVDSADYTIAGSTLTYTGVYTIGDILTVSGNEFVKTQVLETEQDPRIGVQFGYSIDNNTHGTEIVVGAPFALSTTNQEGAGFRYTNGGARFGTITGTEIVDVTTTRNILINGYLVELPAGDAFLTAKTINNAGISNVQAANTDGILTIGLINQNIASADQELTLAASDYNTFAELGIKVFTQTQTILCPHKSGATQFGTVVKFNEHNSIAISAPVGTRYSSTTFDFTDDENLHNDTVFDNNSTQFVDTYPNVGAVYTYDYLSNYNESLLNIGAYTYAQSVNSIDETNGQNPRYGSAIEWHDDKIVIGTPNFRPDTIDGQITVYINTTGTENWVVYRQSSEVVDINSIYNIQLFSAESNQTLMNLDYMDPLQGKLLGVVRQNIDVISNIDPANYNNATNQGGIVWGDAQVGTIWFDTSNIRYINYHQNDNTYNAKYWGTLFPGSDVAVYSWISSSVIPSSYQGTGVPKDITSYTVQTTINSSNTITPVYYFWVRNTGVVFPNKGLADLNIASYIANPQQSGVSYLAPLASDTVALYNSKPYINANDTVLHVGYGLDTDNNPSHQEFSLIRQNYAQDFLPGLPGTGDYLVPESLYDRMLDSLCGVDETGAVVPNPLLPKLVQSGVLARPRQGFFYNRYLALKNYIQYANTIMALYPIVEIREDAVKGFLQKSGEFYNTPDYWNYVNWWAVGYDNNTKATLQVPIYADLSALEVANGTIVTVEQNSQGNSETYRYNSETNSWIRIGVQNGTIEFSSSLYDYAAAGYGFSGTFFDTDTFDYYPSEETRWIVRALVEQIYINELLIHRNKSLILLFEYIQEETVENQNYLPWLNKTSLIDVSHKIRELKPLQNYLSDNQEFLSGYVNETKPYHVVVKDFLFDYTGGDIYPGTITDFDLPAEFNTTIDKFVSPQLVYGTPINSYEYQYETANSIWQTASYQNWFDNYGVSIGQSSGNELIGQIDYPIAKLLSYITPTTDSFIVDNVQGFPINGTVKLYYTPTNYELIGYASVNRETNVISGLTRGLDGTLVSYHIPSAQIYIDLPPVILLNGGKNYANPPRVIATIPDSYPAPHEEAVLEAVMSGDTVTSINVINPGRGYAVSPDIRIDPATVYEFASANVNVNSTVVGSRNTIEIYAPELENGDLVRYVAGTTNIGGLSNDQWYYINVLDSTPTTIMAFYTTYADALQDTNRVKLLSQGTGTQKIELGAKASVIPAGYPVRENNITLRFDRTTYDTQVTDWTPNTFYGSEFVSYTLDGSSSNVSLAQVQPDIYNILSSAEGTVFPISSISNDEEMIWSSGPGPTGRKVLEIVDSKIGLSFVADSVDAYPSGSTIGFTVGMPIKFTGQVGTDIVAGQTYYVAEVIDLEYFTISDTVDGAPLTLTNFTPTNDMNCFTATVTNTAVITTSYPGIRQVVATSSDNNILTVALTDIGTGGTSGLYTNAPVYFTNNVFGGVEENQVYYVTSVLGNQQFTLSLDINPVTAQIIQINLADQIIIDNSTGLSVNDPIVFDSMVINGEPVDTFGSIEKQTIYYIKTIDNNIITISETIGGATFNTTVVSQSTSTFCYLTSQSNTLPLTTTIPITPMTMTIGLPVSPGQVNGQKFTFYPTSQSYADITTSSYGNLVEKTIVKTLSMQTHGNVITGNQIAISPNTSSLYINIPFSVSRNIGGLYRLDPVTSERKVYYACNIANIQVNVLGLTTSQLTFNGNALNDQLTVSTITSGTGLLYPGMLLTGNNVEENTYITEQISGTPGGVGVYKVSRDYFVATSLTGINASTTILNMDADYYTDMIYEGMPITFTGAQPVGGLLTGFKYYVRHIIDDTQFTVSVVEDEGSTSVTPNNNPLVGTGGPAMQAYLPAGQFVAGDEYFIQTIGSTNFASIGAQYLINGSSVVAGNYYIINDVGAGSDVFWTNIAGTPVNAEKDTIVYATNSGTMTLLTGTAYLVNFTATGIGSGTGTARVKITSDEDGPALWQQQIVQPAVFDIGYVLGGYNVIINDGGIGFTQNNTITIAGNLLGGTTPENDLTLTVSRINAIQPGTYSWSLPIESNGTITKTISSGTPIGSTADYFLEVTGANTFKVYSDQLLRNPVSGIDFPYNGYTTTNITNVLNGTDIVLTDASGFSVNDIIVFTNTQELYLIAGQTYYVVSKNTNTITISDNPGDAPIDAYDPLEPNLVFTSNQPTAARPGSFMLLPEPFYFNPSIVKYNNKVWMCTVSNNDSEFVFGKWTILSSGSPRLNALDRAKGYYNPTVNMPGYDLPQLFTGLEYPNTTYRGNEFEKDAQFPIDTQLADIPFDPSHLNMPAVAFDGTNYLAPANLPNYAGIVADLEVTDDWLLAKISDQTLAFTDLLHNGTQSSVYIMTSANTPTPLFTSNNYQIWSTSGWFVPFGTPFASIEFEKQRLIAAGLSLQAVTSSPDQSMFIVAGKNILTSTDTTYWFERLVAEGDKTFYDVSYVESASFTGYIAVGTDGTDGIIYKSTDGITWTDATPVSTRRFYGVTSGFGNIYVVGADGIILTSTDATVWSQTTIGGVLKKVVFASNLLVTVGEAGLVAISTDGITWTIKGTVTTENLNNLMYVAVKNEWTIVGDNNTILQTNDVTASPVIWDTTQLFSAPEPEYTVKGDPFLSGYGPEELVPGIVSDQLTMIVNTRPGTNWPATEYAHAGYNVVSIELAVQETNEYSFDGIVQIPATISVYVIENGIGNAIYEGADYTIDYVNKIVTLTNNIVSPQKLRIDIYEVGNGNQLVKSSTDIDPIQINLTTGFDEIFLNCNYVGLSYTGGGIVNPGSDPVIVEATETNSVDDTILCADITQFTLNGEIYFSGAVFGGVQANTPYYVKSINSVRSTIIISDTLVGGVAGPIFNLSTQTGSMTVVIQKGAGDLFTEPAVFFNGNKLIAGRTNYVIATNGATNGVVTLTTSNMVAGQKIKFSETMFGGVEPNVTYYIRDILSTTEFSLSDGVGDPVTLITTSGSAIFVTEDYAVAIADNQVNAKVIFAEHYDMDTDYISYSFFDQTDPQYGFTVPMTEWFNGNNTTGPFELTNYIGGFNSQNAVVEVNGLRINPSDYVISFATQSLQFDSLTPTGSDIIAVTTYNDTQRQYLFTTEYTSKQVTPIVYVDNNITISEPAVVITTATAHNLSQNDLVRIDGVTGSIQLNNVLFSVNVISLTQFSLYEYTPGEDALDSAPITDVSTYTSGGYVWLSQTWMLEDMFATSSGTEFMIVAEVDGLVVDTPVYFTEDGVTLGDATSIPEIIAGTEYYIREVNEFTNEFSISNTRGGVAKTLTAVGSCNIRVTQWEQTNVDRLWVTVNGERVASSNLRLNEANEVSILAEVTTSDDVVITSMMPSASPDADTYIQVVDKAGEGAVYRANTQTRTWLTKFVGQYDDTIRVKDVTNVTNITSQDSVAPVPTLGYFEIGLYANKNDIISITVYNNNPARLGYIDQDYLRLQVSGLGPFVQITDGTWIEEGDELTITVLLGKTLFINGEYMIITAVDGNTLSVQRGAYGSPIRTYIPVYSTVYSLLEDNKMSEINYNDTWNKIPGVYNTAEGDPLQIASGSAPNFLRVDIT